MLSKEQYQKDAEVLRKAMKGWGSDEEPIIDLTSKRSNADRQQILKEYKTAYGRDALEDLNEELGGDLGACIQAMFKTPIDYDCEELYKAMKGGGTDEETLIEIIGSRKNSHLEQIKKRYKELYNAELEAEVKDETSGDIQNFLISLLQCNRSENENVDDDKVAKDVEDLYEAGEGSWGTEESTFNKIFTTRSPHELYHINKKYIEKTGKSLFHVIDSEFSGDLKNLYETVLLAQVNPPEYFAKRIREACKGMGTNDKLLIRILVTRDEVDLKEINSIYKIKYGMTLKEQVADECGGDYKNLLLALIQSDNK